MIRPVIWQYWETRGHKPAFVDGLHQIAKRNSGAEVICVTPESLRDYLPELPDGIECLEEMAHKADVIRALLVERHGGMWLDSDAIVLADLSWMFKLLEQHEFVGFNDDGMAGADALNVRINCFLARPGSVILRGWSEAQQRKLGASRYDWTELGTDLLDPVVLRHLELVKLLPFRTVCPIPWDRVSIFSSKWQDAASLLRDVSIVMLSNKALGERQPELAKFPIEVLAEDDTLLADILRAAMRLEQVPPTLLRKVIRRARQLVPLRQTSR